VSEFSDFFTNNPEMEETLRVGNMLGYELLLREMVAEGLSPTQSQETLAHLAFSEPLEVSEQDLQRLDELIGQTLRDLGQKHPDLAARIDVLAEIVESERSA
jgi:hypothetical protein